MKCIILLTLVALCYSYPYGTGYGYGTGRNININEDGTIVISGANGKRIVINKGIGSSGQKSVDISVSGPNIPTKRIQINEQNQLSVVGQGEYNDVIEDTLRDKRSSKDSKKRSQGDILAQIFAEYQGDIDQYSYRRLLGEIYVAVQNGQLSPIIYDVLQSLNQVQGQVGQGGSLGGRQGILDLLRQRVLEQELQLQQEQQYQQLLQQRSPIYGQQIQYPYVQRVQDVGLDVSRQQILPVQTPSREGGLVSGIRGLGVSGQQGLGGYGSITGRTLWGRGLLGSQVPVTQTVPGQLSSIIQQEREIVGEPSLIQQQKLEQQQQLQQQLWEQHLLQQQEQQLLQQQEQQQLLQQLQQQQVQQQLLQQGQLWQQPSIWRGSLVGGGRYVQTRGQGLWQQQPGVSSQVGLYGGYGQGIPLTQRVPLVL